MAATPFVTEERISENDFSGDVPSTPVIEVVLAASSLAAASRRPAIREMLSSSS